MSCPAILIIDIQPELYLLLGKLLKNIHQVVQVRPQDLTIEFIENNQFDVVVVGNIEPASSKLDLIAALKAWPLSPPIIHIGTELTRDGIIKAFRAGASDVLVQPIKREELLASLLRISRGNRNNFLTRAFCRLKNWLRSSAAIHNAVASEDGSTGLSTTTLLPDEIPLPNRDETTVLPLHGEWSLTIPATKKIITPHSAIVESNNTGAVSSLNGFLLGPFQIVLNGILLDAWPSKKGRSLLAYLLYHHGDKNLRDILMEKFWPNSSTESARNSLNGVLHGIRKILHEVDATREHIIFKHDSYVINPDIEIQLDHELFLQHWRNAKRLERKSGISIARKEYESAIKLYKGDFLEDEPYEDWPSAERENIREVYLFILDRLSCYYGSCKNYSMGITLCKKILRKDDCREDIHSRLMLYYYQSGHRDMSIKQYQKCLEALRLELDVDPSKSTTELFHHIREEGPHLDERQINLYLSDY